jgi:hypothetical protein
MFVDHEILDDEDIDDAIKHQMVISSIPSPIILIIFILYLQKNIGKIDEHIRIL